MLKYIMDGGHGWLAVPLAEFPDAEQFGTGYGFIDRQAGVVYLEEDCEATAFLRAHPHDRKQIKGEYVEGDAPLRSLPRNERRLESAWA